MFIISTKNKISYISTKFDSKCLHYKHYSHSLSGVEPKLGSKGLVFKLRTRGLKFKLSLHVHYKYSNPFQPLNIYTSTFCDGSAKPEATDSQFPFKAWLSWTLCTFTFLFSTEWKKPSVVLEDARPAHTHMCTNTHTRAHTYTLCWWLWV